jgi:hypothetical protein
MDKRQAAHEKPVTIDLIELTLQVLELLFDPREPLTPRTRRYFRLSDAERTSLNSETVYCQLFLIGATTNISE